MNESIAQADAFFDEGDAAFARAMGPQALNAVKQRLQLGYSSTLKGKIIMFFLPLIPAAVGWFWPTVAVSAAAGVVVGASVQDSTRKEEVQRPRDLIAGLNQQIKQMQEKIAAAVLDSRHRSARWLQPLMGYQPPLARFDLAGAVRPAVATESPDDSVGPDVCFGSEAVPQMWTDGSLIGKSSTERIGAIDSRGQCAAPRRPVSVRPT